MLLSLEDFRFSLWSIRQRPIVAFFFAGKFQEHTSLWQLKLG